MPLNTQEFGNTQAHSETGQRDDGSVTHDKDKGSGPMDIKKYIDGAKFPANKNTLAEYAAQRQAPGPLIDLIKQLPTSEFGSKNDTKLTEYNNVDEVIKEIQKIA
jgi:hypothetical protein